MATIALSTELCANPALSSAAAAPPNSVDVRDKLFNVLRALQTPNLVDERRRTRRYPYPYPVFLTPVERHNLVPMGETIRVMGKQISESGIDFYHGEPIPYRFMIASLESEPNCWLLWIA